ncbi:hypothetical protein J2T13_003530 [Paenibacillus sp. DS2015]|uniref:hypothetical protein n=1 Tax=Paenibacillus sp. DS2015 TaxID=3373917 RepID=UPI003D202651
MGLLITMFVFQELGHNMADAGLVILIPSLGGIVGKMVRRNSYIKKIGVVDLFRKGWWV